MGPCDCGVCGDRCYPVGRFRREIQKEVRMKFLMAVLVIRFFIGLAGNKEENKNKGNVNPGNGKVRHPAEYDLR